jgi:Na+-driven multidrug efflux pump
VPKLINIAWPAVLQSILANCYAFNDYVFIGHIPDPAVSAAGTAALSASVGLQVCHQLALIK